MSRGGGQASSGIKSSENQASSVYGCCYLELLNSISLELHGHKMSVGPPAVLSYRLDR